MDKQVNPQVAALVVRKLAESGASSAELAAHLQISEQTLMRRLTSQTPFTVDEVGLTAAFLGCPLHELWPARTAA